MKRLWAPWRMEYISSEKRPDKGKCFLCLDADADDKALVLVRKPAAFAIMNRYPYSNGHVMVVPNRHVGSIEDLTDEELLEMMRLVRTISSRSETRDEHRGAQRGDQHGEGCGSGARRAHPHPRSAPVVRRYELHARRRGDQGHLRAPLRDVPETEEQDRLRKNGRRTRNEKPVT